MSADIAELPRHFRIMKLFVFGNDIQHDANKGTQQIVIHCLDETCMC